MNIRQDDISLNNHCILFAKITPIQLDGNRLRKTLKNKHTPMVNGRGKRKLLLRVCESCDNIKWRHSERRYALPSNRFWCSNFRLPSTRLLPQNPFQHFCQHCFGVEYFRQPALHVLSLFQHYWGGYFPQPISQRLLGRAHSQAKIYLVAIIF